MNKKIIIKIYNVGNFNKSCDISNNNKKVDALCKRKYRYIKNKNNIEINKKNLYYLKLYSN